MKLLLLPVLLTIIKSVVYSQELSAINPKHHVNVGEKYISEVECLKRLDAILKRKWEEELNTVPTTDLGNLGKTLWENKDSSYTRYNTFEEEWLMNDNLPSSRIDQCFRDLVADVVPLMNQREIKCLNEIFSDHVVREIDHTEEFNNILKTVPKEQLPFRKFISFVELVDVMFQNRNPDALTDLERVLYEHAESYLITDEDRIRRTYVGSQDCEWQNAKALREVSSEKAKFAEFASQVRRSVNTLVGGQLVKSWNLNTTIPIERYERWLQARQDMTKRIEKEIKQLRKQRKDVQWLCEYATQLAFVFSDKELNILLTEGKSWVHFEVSDIASNARASEKALGKLNDFRHAAIKKFADKYEEGTRCLLSFLHLIQNHRKYDAASGFMDEHYSYPEIYCKGKGQDFGLVQVSFCNCIGSFCITHPLAALFSNEYVMTQGANGTYHVVRSGRKSRRKVTHCHTMANGNNGV